MSTKRSYIPCGSLCSVRPSQSIFIIRERGCRHGDGKGSKIFQWLLTTMLVQIPEREWKASRAFLILSNVLLILGLLVHNEIVRALCYVQPKEEW